MAQPLALSAVMGMAAPQRAAICLEGEDFLFTPKDSKLFIEEHSSILMKGLAVRLLAAEPSPRHPAGPSGSASLGCSGQLQGLRSFLHEAHSLIPALLGSCRSPPGVSGPVPSLLLSFKPFCATKGHDFEG